MLVRVQSSPQIEVGVYNGYFLIVAFLKKYTIIVKCIIPKYSLYLINDRNTEYVSTSIKVLKP